MLADIPPVATAHDQPLKLYLATNNKAIGALIAQDDQEGVE